MLKSIKGVFRNGKIDLLEPPPTQEDSHVVVTFLPLNAVDLRARGIDEVQAEELRAKFNNAAGDDWNSPDMDVYDEL